MLTRLMAMVPLVLVLALPIPTFGFAREAICGNRAPINTLKELWPALYACWTPPPGSGGMAVTLVFSVRRDGSLIGKPRATYSKSNGDLEMKKKFFASVLEALHKALPPPLTDSFGGVLAGEPLALLFGVKEYGKEL